MGAELVDLQAIRLGEHIDPYDVLTCFGQHWARVMAGEAKLAKMIYLIGTSRLLAKPMHCVLKGPSGGGKSEIRKQTLRFFPAGEVVSFTAMSDKALIYDERSYEHKILSMAEAEATSERKFQDYMLRELMSEGRIAYTLPTGPVIKDGPVSFMVTTTKDRLHRENETRMLSLRVDASEEQTRRIIEKIGEEAAGGGVTVEAEEYAAWHLFQRNLADVMAMDDGSRRGIVIPYAKALAKMIRLAGDVRMRRDYNQLIGAIQVHAVLHHELRYKDNNGCIHANIEHDYATVQELMADWFAVSNSKGVSQAVLEAVRKLQKSMKNVTAEAVSKLLELHKSVAHRHLQDAKKLGLVENLETRTHRPGQYRTTEEGERQTVLPDWEELKAYR